MTKIASKEYKLSEAVRKQVEQLNVAANNIVAGARLQLEVPPEFIFEPSTGCFIAPPQQKAAERSKT